jgi:hypothetical protein
VRPSRINSTTIASVGLAVLVLAAGAVALWFGWLFVLGLLREGGEVGDATNALLLAALAAVGYLYRQSRDKRKELEGRLADHKRALYEGYVDVFKDLMAASRAGKDVGTPEHVDRLSTFAFRSLLVASDDVVRAHIRFVNVARISPEPTTGMPAVADVLIAIRRDMGLNTKLSALDLMGVFVKELDDARIAAGFATWESAKSAWDEKMGWPVSAARKQRGPLGSPQ